VEHFAESSLLETGREPTATPPFALPNFELAASVSRRIDPMTLRLFVAVMDTGTIAGAAARENIAPSAISKRLSDLERNLKTVLIGRSNRGIEPTSAGQELLRLARTVLNELDNIYWQIKDHSAGTRGSVRLIANISAMSEFLPAFIRDFSRLFPNVEILVQERTSSQIVKNVLANEADIGIFVRAGALPQGVEVYPFRSDELAVIVPFGHALDTAAKASIADLVRYEFVGLPPGSQINQALVSAARVAGLKADCRVQVASFDAACSFVAAGIGIAMMPRTVAERFAGFYDLRVVALAEAWARRDFLICTRSSETMTMAQRRFMEHLRSY
jgi:DNA-binding transcriptional LysR family regulator